MTRRLMPLAAATMLIGTIAPSLRAQAPADLSAYVGFTRTPAGALSPGMTNTVTGRRQNGASLALRFGHLSSSGLNFTTNSYGVTGLLPAGSGSTLSLTGGVVTTDCTGCKAELMLGAGGDMRVYASPFGTTATSPLFTVSLDGQLGYGNRDPGSYVSGVVGAPIALVARGTGMQFVPFLIPGFGFARESVSGVSSSGMLMVIGGGLGIYNTSSNVSVNLGFQHPFVADGQTMIGLSVSFGGK